MGVGWALPRHQLDHLRPEGQADLRLEQEGVSSDKVKGHSALLDTTGGPHLEWDTSADPAYPRATGPNLDELLRVIDSLQLTDNEKVATPANWKPGGDVVILVTIPK